MSTRYSSIAKVCFTRTWPGFILGTLSCGLLVAATIAPASLAAQDRPGASVFSTRNGIPEAVAVYKGRRVAMTMHYKGAEWLIRNEREREERCSIMLTNLGIKPGMTVCDMGCGNGFYALQMAKMVGPRGQVLGVDIQPEMLKFLRDRMEQKNINNITPILGSLHDPRLPKNQVDLVLLVDVYHEFSH
ncbi:MAG: class I SAM-dependent methyltransferase, partial [Pirellulaceae bacterium]|nr:class I SAM-dependent methyltransferase [Pirellulaceae bacterium]